MARQPRQMPAKETKLLRIRLFKPKICSDGFEGPMMGTINDVVDMEYNRAIHIVNTRDAEIVDPQEPLSELQPYESSAAARAKRQEQNSGEAIAKAIADAIAKIAVQPQPATKAKDPLE